MTLSPQLTRRLGEVVGSDAVTDGPSQLQLHAEDLSFHPGALPDAVVFPSTVKHVSSVMRLAEEHRVPVVPFGAGTSLDGHVVPTAGGISLDLGRLDAIKAVRPGELTSTVEAGVTRLQLDRRLGEHGLFFSVDPGADATLGGMAATNAAGTMTVRYGKMRPQVLALQAVLPGGGVIRTGTRAAKSSAGYDLTGLLVGSEGTLAVITELTVRVQGIPEASAVLRASFADVDAACDMVLSTVSAGVPVLRLEYLDGWEIEALNRFHGSELRQEPTLLIEVAGAPESVAVEVEYVHELLAECGARDIVEERDPTRRAKLWRARHDLFFAEKAMHPGLDAVSTDVCVPLEELRGALRETRAALDRHALIGGVSAHAGDGNIHAAVMLDGTSSDDLHRLDRLVEDLAADATARGGTCSGEHGIGLGKVQAMAAEHADCLPLMRALKRAFDPSGVMNPGKVLSSEAKQATHHTRLDLSTID